MSTEISMMQMTKTELLKEATDNGATDLKESMRKDALEAAARDAHKPRRDLDTSHIGNATGTPGLG